MGDAYVFGIDRGRPDGDMTGISLLRRNPDGTWSASLAVVEESTASFPDGALVVYDEVAEMTEEAWNSLSRLMVATDPMPAISSRERAEAEYVASEFAAGAEE